MALYIGTLGRSGWHCHADLVALSIGRSGSQPPEYSVTYKFAENALFYVSAL